MLAELVVAKPQMFRRSISINRNLLVEFDVQHDYKKVSEFHVNQVEYLKKRRDKGKVPFSLNRSK